MVKNLLSMDYESLCLPESVFIDENERKKIAERYLLTAHKEILGLLEKYETELTFFVLGELFEWYPELIEEIEDYGHEVAYHTHRHTLLTSEGILMQSLNQSKKFLRKFKPGGFRAPKIFMKKEYLILLKQHGFKYDSSVYSQKTVEEINGITEIPVSMFNYFDNLSISFPAPLQFKDLLKGIPFGSGYFLGLFQSNIDFFINKFNKHNKPATLFVHNWQIKPQFTSFPDAKYILTHPLHLPYTLSIKKTLEHLLKNFEFYTFRDFLEEI